MFLQIHPKNKGEKTPIVCKYTYHFMDNLKTMTLFKHIKIHLMVCNLCLY